MGRQIKSASFKKIRFIKTESVVYMTNKLVQEEEYLPKICTMLKEIEQEEQEAIQKAAYAAYQSIKAGGLLHAFSTGHSHMIVEELFYRSGGLVPINPILREDLMLHSGAITSTQLERKSGIAKEILEKAGLSAGDTILLSSNSGINTVPIEAALYAKEKGLTVISITSLKASEHLKSRHPSGKKLCDVSDIVIDNHAPLGDGLLKIPENGQPTGGASTFGSLFIGQRIVLSLENRYIKDGLIPPVLSSANLPGGDEFNLALIEHYQKRIKALH